ncbi:type VI secretion system tip protein VgrG [Pseudomonas aeruginosa]
MRSTSPGRARRRATRCTTIPANTCRARTASLVRAQPHRGDPGAARARAPARRGARGIGAGHLFRLIGYPAMTENREYPGGRRRNTGWSRNSTKPAAAAPARRFESELDCIDASQSFTSPAATPVPVVRGPQTAVVVGPKGEEIWTDQYGRVKGTSTGIADQSNEESSCWIRVSQAWAGKNWGSMEIPRIGQEVIISFPPRGDPDRPIASPGGSTTPSSALRSAGERHPERDEEPFEQGRRRRPASTRSASEDRRAPRAVIQCRRANQDNLGRERCPLSVGHGPQKGIGHDELARIGNNRTRAV